MADPLEGATAALEHWSADQVASLVVTAVGLAALRHPLELRAALAQAFNPKAAREQLEAFRDQCRMTRAQLDETWEHAREVAHLVEELTKELAELELRREQLLEAVGRLEGRVAILSLPPVNGARP